MDILYLTLQHCTISYSYHWKKNFTVLYIFTIHDTIMVIYIKVHFLVLIWFCHKFMNTIRVIFIYMYQSVIQRSKSNPSSLAKSLWLMKWVVYRKPLESKGESTLNYEISIFLNILFKFSQKFYYNWLEIHVLFLENSFE